MGNHRNQCRWRRVGQWEESYVLGSKTSRICVKHMRQHLTPEATLTNYTVSSIWKRRDTITTWFINNDMFILPLTGHSVLRRRQSSWYLIDYKVCYVCHLLESYSMFSCHSNVNIIFSLQVMMMSNSFYETLGATTFSFYTSCHQETNNECCYTTKTPGKCCIFHLLHVWDLLIWLQIIRYITFSWLFSCCWHWWWVFSFLFNEI